MKPRRLRHRPYPTVYAWLDANGKTQDELALLAGISNTHLANVLRKTRSCSFEVALRLSRICNVPLESIASDRQLSGVDGN
jgi:transcriptional regulator with XRE-family HTH domain